MDAARVGEPLESVRQVVSREAGDLSQDWEVLAAPRRRDKDHYEAHRGSVRSRQKQRARQGHQRSQSARDPRASVRNGDTAAEQRRGKLLALTNVFGECSRVCPVGLG
jgi:hypothetical protein